MHLVGLYTHSEITFTMLSKHTFEAREEGVNTTANWHLHLILVQLKKQWKCYVCLLLITLLCSCVCVLRKNIHRRTLSCHVLHSDLNNSSYYTKRFTVRKRKQTISQQASSFSWRRHCCCCCCCQVRVSEAERTNRDEKHVEQFGRKETTWDI